MSDLWTYALDLYARPSVKEACLKLQDEVGADVCLLLLCCWAAEENLGEWPPEMTKELSAQSYEFQTNLLAPLRKMRTCLKNNPTYVFAREWANTLRENLLANELLIERELLGRYEATVSRFLDRNRQPEFSRDEKCRIVRGNFEASSPAVDFSKNDTAEEMMATLLKVAFPG
ncbi:TIGR02444 family protein [Sneathiella glossodoripedis]|uniref:TIGR02444 family protein n=1 Tax=Sneathiella glossodoripedis TaxID=418853 RepID=UPI000470E283|nr:TIGR02444 family protein [Sneathiella glossodoripedis]